MKLFTSHEIMELENAAYSAGLANNERRPLLFRGLPNSFIEALPVFSRPSDQLKSDLAELNDLSELLGVKLPPLAIWLENAISLAYTRPESEIFSRLRESLIYTPQSTIRPVMAKDFQELRSRREWLQTHLTLLTRPTYSYRAVVVGPLFLHPTWYMERHNRKSQLPSYDEALKDFIFQFGHRRTHEIRFIFTFSARYRAKVDTFVEPEERSRFQDDLLEAVDVLWGTNASNGPDLCCVHPGFLHIQTIFDNAVITTYRRSQMTPISEGFLSHSPDVLERERAIFDTIFDTCTCGQDEELERLKEHICKLW